MDATKFSRIAESGESVRKLELDVPQNERQQTLLVEI